MWNQAYHVISCTHERKPVFADFRSARLLVRILMHEQDLASSETMAFVVMPDHVHWLMSLAKECDLSARVNAVKSASARAINRRLRRSGRIWQRGYFDRAMHNDDNLATVAEYITLNPVRAGIVTRRGDYPHWDSIWV